MEIAPSTEGEMTAQETITNPPSHLSMVVSWLKTPALDLESRGSNPTSVMAFFLFPLCLT